jgi:ArsR family transcriptional regulator, arsenate/arsenite/antimonite-responsive transcriptional repressor
MRTAVKPRVDRIFRALSDATRLRILNLLESGELCVCDLVSRLNVPQPTASRHLAYLRRAGLVVARKDGHWSYYRLADAGSRLHECVLECLTHCREEMPQLRRDLARLKRDGRTQCCD